MFLIASEKAKTLTLDESGKRPPMVVEAEVHENYYLEIESDSEISDNEASGEDMALKNFRKQFLEVHHPFFSYTNQTRL